MILVCFINLIEMKFLWAGEKFCKDSFCFSEFWLSFSHIVKLSGKLQKLKWKNGGSESDGVEIGEKSVFFIGSKNGVMHLLVLFSPQAL